MLVGVVVITLENVNCAHERPLVVLVTALIAAARRRILVVIRRPKLRLLLQQLVVVPLHRRRLLWQHAARSCSRHLAWGRAKRVMVVMLAVVALVEEQRGLLLLATVQ